MDILKQFNYINRKVRDFGNTFGKSSPEYLKLTTAIETLIPDEMTMKSKGGYLQLDKQDAFRIFNDGQLQENIDALENYFKHFGGLMTHARPYFEEAGTDLKNKKDLRNRLDELREMAKGETIRQGLTDSFYILLDDLPNKHLIRAIKDSMSGSVGKGNQQKQWQKYDNAMQRFIEALKSGEAYESQIRLKDKKDAGTTIGDIFRR